MRNASIKLILFLDKNKHIISFLNKAREKFQLAYEKLGGASIYSLFDIFLGDPISLIADSLSIPNFRCKKIC